MKAQNILLTEKHLELLGEHQLKKTPCMMMIMMMTMIMMMAREAQIAQTCKPGLEDFSNLQGVFFNWCPPKSSKCFSK